MANGPAKRAKRTGFLIGEENTLVNEFQFNPYQLEDSNAVKLDTRVLTGQSEPDVLWVSTEPKVFTWELFIDRTVESLGGGQFDEGAFKSNRSEDAIMTIASSTLNFASQYLNPIRSKISSIQGYVNRIVPIQYKANFKRSDYNPSYNIDPNDAGFYENVGVLAELDKLLETVKPKSYGKGGGALLADFNYDRRVFKLADELTENTSTFTPAPVVTFVYGNIWKQGYIQSLNYRMSVFNQILVPQRLEVTIALQVIREGFLAEINNLGIDYYDEQTFGDGPNVNSIA